MEMKELKSRLDSEAQLVNALFTVPMRSDAVALTTVTAISGLLVMIASIVFAVPLIRHSSVLGYFLLLVALEVPWLLFAAFRTIKRVKTLSYDCKYQKEVIWTVRVGLFATLNAFYMTLFLGLTCHGAMGLRW